jgi:hypothetical protein
VSGGTITTVAGTGVCAFGGEAGAGTAAWLNRPHDVFFLGEDLIIADTANNRVRRLGLPGGVITTIAGNGLAGFFGDRGEATSAQLNAPEAVAAGSNEVFIADTGNDRVRRVDMLTGIIDTVAGEGGLTIPVGLSAPAGVALGSLTVANTDEHTLILAAGVDEDTGQPTHRFRPAAPCNLFGAATIDWALPALFLGLLLGRRRLGTLFVRLRSVATPS